MKSSSTPRGQPKIRDFMAQISQSVEAIKLRLVGDVVLGSTGIVQDVEQLKLDQKKTAEVLADVAKTLTGLEVHRTEQLRVNAEQLKIAEDVKLVRTYFRAACVILPVVGGVVGWLLKTGALRFAN